ncbi:MAG: oxidoreductase [Nitrospirae bacterium]|nr:MAG: oxidoreductase [Nitrospirota bacterium]
MTEHAYHVHGELWTIKELYTYPNEYLYWTINIVLYPFLTGLVAGAFVLSSLYHVFDREELKPVAKFALVFSFALLVFAPAPLLFHLTQPFRALNTILTPHFYSAIAAFNIVYFTYMFIVLSEIWFSYRAFIVEQAKTRKGLIGFIYKVLTLGSYDVSERALHTDERVIRVLAAVGIPAAIFLHGYVGFIFGSVKTVPLWKTPLMPFIFLMSAVISGIAICIATYLVVCWITKRRVPQETVEGMASALKWFLVITFVLESMDIIFHAYVGEESWEILSKLIFERIRLKLFVLQWGCGMLIPFLLLLISPVSKIRAFIASVLVLIGVFMMRWDVIIGGQEMSRSFAGFMHYKLPIELNPFRNLEAFKEGIASIIIFLTSPFILFYILNKFLPVLQNSRSK